MFLSLPEHKTSVQEASAQKNSRLGQRTSRLAQTGEFAAELESVSLLPIPSDVQPQSLFEQYPDARKSRKGDENEHTGSGKARKRSSSKTFVADKRGPHQLQLEDNVYATTTKEADKTPPGNALIPRPSKSKEHKRTTAGQLSQSDFNLVSLNIPKSAKNKALGDSSRCMPKIIDQSMFPSQRNLETLNILSAPGFAPQRDEGKSLRRTAQTFLHGLTKD